MSTGQARDFGVAEVDAALLPEFEKEGYVRREGVNMHLQGCLLHERSRPGQPVEVVPVTNELIQIEEVTKSLKGETALLTGYADEEGLFVPGEIPNLDRARLVLLNWLTRDEEDETWVKSYLGEVADKRVNATGEANQDIGVIADEARNLKDKRDIVNPGAMLAKTIRLQRAFQHRYAQLVKNMSVHEQRTARTLGWLFQENRRVAEAYETATRLLDHPTGSQYDFLLQLAGNIAFTVQPFNRFRQQVGGGLPDAQPLEELRQNIIFSREKNYLVTPLRQLGAKNLDVWPERRWDYIQEDRSAVQARAQRLQELSLSGPAATLRGEVLPLLEELDVALKDRSPKEIRQLCITAGQLLIFQCRPKQPNELTEAFYGPLPAAAQAA